METDEDTVTDEPVEQEEAYSISPKTVAAILYAVEIEDRALLTS